MKSGSSCTRRWSWIQSPDVSFQLSISKRKRQIEKLTTTWSKSEKKQNWIEDSRLGNLFGSIDVQLQYLFQPDIPDFSALCHFWTACQTASIQSWKLREEESWRISGSGKVSNFAGSTSSGLAKCRSSTANEFQNLWVSVSISWIQTRTVGFIEGQSESVGRPFSNCQN